MGKEGSIADFGGKKTQGYQSDIKAFSQAKVTSTFKWTAPSESLKRLKL